MAIHVSFVFPLSSERHNFPFPAKAERDFIGPTPLYRSSHIVALKRRSLRVQFLFPSMRTVNCGNVKGKRTRHDLAMRAVSILSGSSGFGHTNSYKEEERGKRKRPSSHGSDWLSCRLGLESVNIGHIMNHRGYGL